jgi:hypothetical protein
MNFDAVAKSISIQPADVTGGFMKLINVWTCPIAAKAFVRPDRNRSSLAPAARISTNVPSSGRARLSSAQRDVMQGENSADAVRKVA